MGETNMKKWMTIALTLSAAFAASGKVHAANVNYPWCVIGDSRGRDCIFSSREQCAQDGRNRGFGGQCMQNPFYNPALGPLGEPIPAKRLIPAKRKSRRHPE